MNHFYISPGEFEKDTISITGEDLKHLSKVLRLIPGDQVEIYNGNNQKALGTILDVNNNRALIKLENKEKTNTENRKAIITLFQGMPKKGKLELITQKATELGVDSIVPFYTKRSVVKPSRKESKKTDRYNRIAYEAAKQSGRGKIPTVLSPILIQELTELLSNFDLILLAYEDEHQHSLKKTLESSNFISEPLKIALIIGPEGGFDQAEVELLKEKGAQVISLGNRILRTETAGIATISQLNFYFEEE